MSNIDLKTVEGFGFEWSTFDQSSLSPGEYLSIFDCYFHIFPWDSLPPDAVGFDLGCGSGRWAKGVAPRVGKLHCVDASREALAVARRNLQGLDNCEFHQASVDRIPLDDASMDFGYCLGVLHHVPDTLGGLKSCARKLKPGALFLVYLYYAFDNRPFWFRALWRGSDLVRQAVCRLPHGPKAAVCGFLALTVYWPLARLALVFERLGFDVDAFPLSPYRVRSFYSMRTDALDRFGTRLEQRFTAAQIRAMMAEAGLERVEFSKTTYWCAVGFKAREAPAPAAAGAGVARADGQPTGKS